MRRAAKIDANQNELVDVARAMGATVQILSAVGEGCPDLLIGFRKRNLLVEVKDGSKPPSEQVLTPAQKRWHSGWNGRVHIVRNLDELIRLLKNTT